MPRILSLPENTAVDQAISSFGRQRRLTPVPLTATSYAIAIKGGLADVAATRTFRNAETSTIEALLTLPVPVAAAVYALQARIGDRTLNAIAKSRDEARAGYEAAVDSGKTAVLHEELFRGVHLLSVAHVAPGTEIEVILRFALPMALIGPRALLRIPTTVGDIYGDSGLPDSDALVHGGEVLSGEVSLVADCGEALLLGHTLNEGRARVALNAPIDVEIKNWQPETIRGRAADGRGVEMRFTPATGDGDIDAVVLIDHSGSMAGRCSGNAALTKFEAVLLGLGEVASDLRTADRLNLWDFDNTARDLGTARGDQWRTLLRQLAGPDGGTEIGGAIKSVLATRKTRDILLVTDGKSYAIPVQELAQSGVRFNVVLIGEDSIDANVGYLAALTGGQIFIPPDADVTDAVRSAFVALRQAPACQAASGTTMANRSGLAIAIDHSPATTEEVPDNRACAAYAASLVLPSLPEADARQLALAEGLVTHLTSLILVDETGERQPGLPVTRKVALPSPAVSTVRCTISTRFAPSALHCRRVSEAEDRHSRSYSRSRSPDYGFDPASAPAAPIPPTSRAKVSASTRASAKAAAGASDGDGLNLADLPGRIDWRNEGHRLVDGNMIGLDPDVADAIDAAARLDAVRRAAKRFGMSSRHLVIALLARVAARHDRFADRVARAILHNVKARNAVAVAELLGLSRRARAAL